MNDEQRATEHARLDDAWSRAGAGGAGLPPATLAKMERAFGADFSTVTVGEESGPGALASASGEAIRFASGQYGPGTRSGDALIAHELAHVLQQREGRVSGPRGGGGRIDDDELEAEADRFGERAAAGEVVAAAPTAPPAASASAPVQRKPRTPAWAAREADVREVQKHLIRLDLLDVADTGKLAKLTIAALDVAFGGDRWRELDDVADVVAVLVAQEKARPVATAKPAAGAAPSWSKDVDSIRAIQTVLIRLDRLDHEDTGRLATLTEVALDAAFGGATWRTMDAAAVIAELESQLKAPAPTAKPDPSWAGDAAVVRKVQEQLIRLHHVTFTKTTGNLAPKTVAGLDRAFGGDAWRSLSGEEVVDQLNAMAATTTPIPTAKPFATDPLPSWTPAEITSIQELLISTTMVSFKKPTGTLDAQTQEGLSFIDQEWRTRSAGEIIDALLSIEQVMIDAGATGAPTVTPATPTPVPNPETSSSGEAWEGLVDKRAPKGEAENYKSYMRDAAAVLQTINPSATPALMGAMIDAEAGAGTWNPSVKAKKSSARGLTQFTNATWHDQRTRSPFVKAKVAEAEKKHADEKKAGTESKADAARFDAKGHLTEKAFRAMRNDAETSIRAGADYAVANLGDKAYRKQIEKTEGVGVDGLDQRALYRYIYLAHHEGVSGAKQLAQIKAGTSYIESDTWNANMPEGDKAKRLAAQGWNASDLTGDRKAKYDELQTEIDALDPKTKGAKAKRAALLEAQRMMVVDAGNMSTGADAKEAFSKAYVEWLLSYIDRISKPWL